MQDELTVNLDGQEVSVSGRVGRMIRFLIRNAETLNTDGKGKVQFAYAGESLVPSRESVFEAID
jgi:hypothetical protein